MRRNFLWSMLVVIMTALMSIGITSCGDDDATSEEGTGGGFTVTSIVGSWAYGSGTKDYMIYTFYADGTGIEYYNINSYNNTAMADYITYSFNNSTKELSIVYTADGDTWRAQVRELTEQRLVLVDTEDNESGVYYRFNGTLPNINGGDDGGNDGDETGSLSSPTNVSASISGSSVNLSWTAVSGATKYYVYRSNSAYGAYSMISTVYATYATDNSPLDGYNYYKIKAANNSQESGFSSYTYVNREHGGEDPQQKPEAPTGVVVSNEGNNYYPSIVVRWNQVKDAKKYRIYRSSSANGYYSRIGETTYSAYTDSNAPTSGSAYYKVTAVNDAGESSYSSYAQYTVSDQDDAFAPAFTYGNCTVSGTTMTLRWTFKTGAGYGKATSVKLRVWNPYAGDAGEWQDTDLSATATSTSFSIATKFDNDGWVKAGIVVSNAKGSYTPGAKIYNIKTGKWLN